MLLPFRTEQQTSIKREIICEIFFLGFFETNELCDIDIHTQVSSALCSVLELIPLMLGQFLFEE
jgi:hypothetical protein